MSKDTPSELEMSKLIDFPYPKYDVLSDWYDGPIVFLRMINFDDPSRENAYLCLLWEREAGHEAYLISALNFDGYWGLIRKTHDLQTVIQNADCWYIIRYRYTHQERSTRIEPIESAPEIDKLPCPGEMWAGQPREVPSA